MFAKFLFWLLETPFDTQSEARFKWLLRFLNIAINNGLLQLLVHLRKLYQTLHLLCHILLLIQALVAHVTSVLDHSSFLFVIYGSHLRLR